MTSTVPRRRCGRAAQFPRYAPGTSPRRAGRAARKLDDAVTAFGRAVDLDGGRAESWYALGDALARLGRTEPARDALRRALTLGLEPSFNARVYAALGRVHAAAGEWTAAARSLRKALDLRARARTIAASRSTTGARW